uniref:MFSD2 lysolipid transporter B, sphingolipid n=1 Tax=Gallus gallus TaxID=9031 RepID=A0A8V0YC28_CHICK
MPSSNVEGSDSMLLLLCSLRARRAGGEGRRPGCPFSSPPPRPGRAGVGRGCAVRSTMAEAARDSPERPAEEEHRLSVCSKLCYAIGGIPNQVAGSAASFSLQIYLLDIARITPFHASLVLFIGKASGAVSDPVAGFFISKSRWRKIGRLMPCYSKYHILLSPCFSAQTRKREILQQHTVSVI